MFSIPEISPSVPAFILKLWHMVSDPSSDNLIRWGKDGMSFIIKDPGIFAAELLPTYYKHNNMASFIRQLNMYGFHKVFNLESNTLSNDRLDYEFSHPWFQRSQPSLLDRIKRKMSNTKEIADMKCDPNIVNKLLQEVQSLKNRQEKFDSRMFAIKAENQALWREHAILRQRHSKQQKVVNQLIQFLVTMVQQSRFSFKRRKGPLMIKDKLSNKSNNSPSNETIICEIESEDNPYNSDLIFTDSDDSDYAQQCTSRSLNNSAQRTSKAGISKSNENSILCNKSKLVITNNKALSGIRRRKLNPPKTINVKRKLITKDEIQDKSDNLVERLKLQPKSPEVDSNVIITSPASVSDTTAGPNTPDIDPSFDISEFLETNNNPNANVENTNRSLIPKDNEDPNTHLETIQNELDLIKELLGKNEGISLDVNTLLSLFNSNDDPISLNMPQADRDRLPETNNTTGNELMAYQNNDLSDLFDMSELVDPVEDEKLDENYKDFDFPDLNTPIVEKEIDFKLEESSS